MERICKNVALDPCPSRHLNSLGSWKGLFPRRCLGPIRSGYDVARLLVAMILLLAGGLKAHQLATEPVIGGGLLDNRWLLMATVEGELFFGLWLLSGALPKPTWALALLLFSTFSCVSLYKALSGHATCGCFGRVPVNPWYTTTLDVGVVVSLLIWRPLAVASFTPPPFARSAAVFCVWLAVGLPTAYAMGNRVDATLSDAGEIVGDGNVVVLEPEKWIGKRFPLLDYIDVGNRLKEGKWLVLLYHHDCPKCQKAITELAKKAQVSGVTRLALIEMPPYAKESEIPETLPTFVDGHLKPVKEWFAETPVVATLLEATVVGTD